MQQEAPGTEPPDLTYACEVLAAGGVVAVPNPPPMTYGLVATEARVVNAAKGRPIDQAVGAALHDREEWQRLVPSLDLSPASVAAVEGLLAQRLSLLLPLRAEVPAPRWLQPAIQAGAIAVFDPRWEPTAAVWERFPRLFGSSANRTREAAARSAAEARAMLGADAAVIDADAYDPRPRLAASTMVAVDPRGRFGLARSGAQDQAYDQAHPQTATSYLDWLAGQLD